jgi:dGTPase
MDIEDAHKLRILTTDETKNLMLNFFDEKRKSRIQETMNIVTDVNEQISYLRSSVIGKLIDQCSDAFVANEEKILNGTLSLSLIKIIPENSVAAYQNCSKTAFDKIYRSQEVLDVELAGYKIIITLLEHLVSAVLTPEKAYSKQLLMRIPEQYVSENTSNYGRIMSVLDYISGMTDIYALDLYRKITGMNIPSL